MSTPYYRLAHQLIPRSAALDPETTWHSLSSGHWSMWLAMASSELGDSLQGVSVAGAAAGQAVQTRLGIEMLAVSFPDPLGPAEPYFAIIARRADGSRLRTFVFEKAFHRQGDPLRVVMAEWRIVGETVMRTRLDDGSDASLEACLGRTAQEVSDSSDYPPMVGTDGALGQGTFDPQGSLAPQGIVASFAPPPRKKTGLALGVAAATVVIALLGVFAPRWGKAGSEEEDHRPLRVEAQTVGLGRGFSGKGSQELYIDVTTEVGAAIRCEPDCGEPKMRSGKERISLALPPHKGARSIRIHVTKGGREATHTIAYDYQPNVAVYPQGDGRPLEVQCYLVDCEGTIRVDDMLTVDLRAKDLKEVRIGKQASTGGEKPTFPVLSFAGGEDIGKVGSTGFRAKLELEIQLGAEKLKAPFEIAVPNSVILAGLASVKNKPIVFIDDSPALARPRGLVVADEKKLEAVGSATKLREVDLVAVRIERARDIACGSYVADGKSVNVTLHATDQELEVYDRRTSKLITKRSLKADSTCPSTFRAGSVPALYSTADERAVRSWLESLVK